SCRGALLPEPGQSSTKPADMSSIDSRLAVLMCIGLISCASLGEENAAIVKSEFIADTMPTPQCHASTIVQTAGDALVAAWFGGKAERDPTVGIWLSRNTGEGWSKPIEVVNGEWPADNTRYPCWNPVLFQPKNGPLLLFYKVGPSPSRWWGMLTTS